MKLVLQRVLDASVSIDGEVKGQIERGLLIFVGISEDDTETIADKMIEKAAKLRIFEDENGKTNLNIESVGGQVLVISQFTLYADCKKGNRPSFVKAGNPVMAENLYQYVLKKCGECFKNVRCGVFGADMKVKLTNDGPFTILLDSREIL